MNLNLFVCFGSVAKLGFIVWRRAIKGTVSQILAKVRHKKISTKLSEKKNKRRFDLSEVIFKFK